MYVMLMADLTRKPGLLQNAERSKGASHRESQNGAF